MNKSLLVVDDDLPFRERLSRSMQKKWFEVDSADSFASAVQIIEKKKNAYSIVVGTFKYRNNAEKQIKLIKSKYPVSTKDKISNVVLIKVSGKQLYESRFENFSKKEAYTACKRLKKYNRDCFVRL